MLTSIRGLFGWSIAAVDGTIGHVTDAYFDDRQWGVRHLVVDTSRWLIGGSVLVPPRSISGLDRAHQSVRSSLTRHQVAQSPDLDVDKPVSRQHEFELSHYYLFPSYAVTTAASVALADPDLLRSAMTGCDPHLRSARAITGYYVHALDGDAGHAEDLLIEDASWAVRHLSVVVRTRWSSRKVLVPAGWIAAISWGAGAIEVSLPAEAIRLAPEYDQSGSIDPQHEARLRRYYGLPPFG
jgi:hypothetical protein